MFRQAGVCECVCKRETESGIKSERDGEEEGGKKERERKNEGNGGNEKACPESCLKEARVMSQLCHIHTSHAPTMTHTHKSCLREASHIPILSQTYESCLKEAGHMAVISRTYTSYANHVTYRRVM